ncbi:MAG: gas vesicle protein GvpG [Ktedonobacterales bacterium]|jgi:hypothetical protein
MRFLSKLLTAPVTGPLDTVNFVVKRINDQVAAEYLDEGKTQADLLDLTMRYERGELDDAAFEEQQAAILQHLNDIRAYKGDTTAGAVVDADEGADEAVSEE